MFQTMFLNRSFAGFVAGIVSSLMVVLAVNNVIVGNYPQMLMPVDLRLMAAWTQDFENLPAWIALVQCVVWGVSITFAAYLSTAIARGVAIVGLGSGLALWFYALGQVFSLPYPWWAKVLTVLLVLVAPLLGMMIGRYPYRVIPESEKSQS